MYWVHVKVREALQDYIIYNPHLFGRNRMSTDDLESGHVESATASRQLTCRTRPNNTGPNQKGNKTGKRRSKNKNCQLSRRNKGTGSWNNPLTQANNYHNRYGDKPKPLPLKHNLKQERRHTPNITHSQRREEKPERLRKVAGLLKVKPYTSPTTAEAQAKPKVWNKFKERSSTAQRKKQKPDLTRR